MEMKLSFKKITSFVRKYKYAVFVLIIGIVLMVIPTKSEEINSPQETIPAVYTSTTQEDLEKILQKIQGAGNVKLLLTIRSGEEYIYYVNEEIDTDQEDSSVRKTVVTVTDSQKNENGLLRYINPEKYLGAVVVCDGADSAVVRQNIIDAVSKATGLRSDQIAVLKMK